MARPRRACVRLVQPDRRQASGVLDTQVGEGLGAVDRRKVWLGAGWQAAYPAGLPRTSSARCFNHATSPTKDGVLRRPDDLVAAATNHKEDVHEYEPSGVGSCQSPSGGCVSLISSGSSAKESAFLEATPDASTVSS